MPAICSGLGTESAIISDAPQRNRTPASLMKKKKIYQATQPSLFSLGHNEHLLPAEHKHTD